VRAIGYLRVSTEEQAASGLGLEAQEKRVRGYAELYELELVDVIVDAGVSAKTLERPGLARALERLDQGEAQVLLVAKLDRLTRSVVDLGELFERFGPDGAELVSVAENVDTRSAAGRLVLNVLVSVAQWEREAIAERTRAALEAKRARGERAGAIPFGYRLEKGVLIIEDHDEQVALLLMREHRAAGRSLNAIAQELTRRGYRPRGRAWRPSSVRAILATDARRRARPNGRDP
jgi:DNA invertase Pin-like site-specific DNA recombinase